MRILIVIGHPRKLSLSSSLAEEFNRGALDAGVETELLYLSDLHFNPNVLFASPHLQKDEPDLISARKKVLAAQHLVLVYPTWWGTTPALLKGFLDRIFISGFGFEETAGGTGYEPLLRGKSCQIITTMDTPSFVYKYIYGAPGHNALRKATLGFCGYRCKNALAFSTVRHSDPEIRSKWLRFCYKKGLDLKGGVFTRFENLCARGWIWFKAIRFQFYPMTFIAYSAGALLATNSGAPLSNAAFWLGYTWIFFAEVFTVLSNEFFDQRTDFKNDQYGPFNGGSRVLANGELTASQIRRGLLVAAALSCGFMAVLFFLPGHMKAEIIIPSVLLFIVAGGYTIPPLKLSYRGLGEITVGVTHSLAVIICGFVYQEGSIADPAPWWLSAPLFFAVLPSIILAGIPDMMADRLVSKRTLAVRLGSKRASVCAIAFTFCAMSLMLAYNELDILPTVFKNLLPGIFIHGSCLIWKLVRYVNSDKSPGRIDGLLILALTFLMWFALGPLINLL